MGIFQHLSSNSGNLKLIRNPTKYLRTVFNVILRHENEEISGDFLVHTKANFPTDKLEKVEVNMLDFLKRHGFNSKRDLARATGAVNYSMAIPNMSVESYSLLASIAATQLLNDDNLDGPQLSHVENIDMLIRMTHALSKHFRGNASPIDEDVSAAFPKFGDICRMYLESGVSLLKRGTDLRYVYQGFDSMVGAHVDQVKYERAKSPEEYLKRKIDICGLLLYFDLNGVLTGETLTEEVRNSAVFKKFQHVTASMCALASDPVSIAFDLSRGIKDDNYSVILMEQGLSAKDAVHYSINRYNQLFIESLVLLAELDRMNICESDRRYLRLHLNAVRGALAVPTNHEVYSPNKGLKCEEIDDKDRVTKCIVDAMHAMPEI